MDTSVLDFISLHFSSVVSIISLIISLFALRLHFKNTKTSSKVYLINRSNYEKSGIFLVFVCAKQLDNSFVLKLVLFNPGPTEAILHSFTVFKRVHPTNYFCRIFNIRLWKEVTEAQWWPTKNSNCYKIKKVEDEYENLLVKDQKDIMVSIPGRIDVCYYKFLVKTSNGGQILYTTIDGFRNYFSRRFEQRRWLFGHRLFASDRGGFVEQGRSLPPPTL